MKICIDARLASGYSGGVEQVVVGLASGLSALTDGPEEYVFLADPRADAWLRPHLGGPCAILPTSSRAAGGERSRPLKEMLRRRARGPTRAINARRAARAHTKPLPAVPRSDGSIERAGVDVIHFPFQAAFLTDVPSLYHPHDLQHLHHPRNFEPRMIALREQLYRAFCDAAARVVMMSSWGRDDIVARYRLAPGRVVVVPWGPVLAEPPADLEAVRRTLRLPARFLLYPAQTFPHKNHLTLLEALSILRDRGTVVPLVCCGYLNDYFDVIRRRVRGLRLGEQVTFLGFRSAQEVRALYELANGLVFPSRFEGWGMPLCEAFATGLPAACSTATCLPAIAGDAALLFDPEDPGALADAIMRLWSDSELRATLAERGRQRAELFTLDRAARHFRALYRQTAGAELTADDQEMLDASPPV